LKNLAKIMAPFAPFSADDIWLKLKNNTDLESVHLADWPKLEKVDKKVIEEMEKEVKTFLDEVAEEVRLMEARQ